MYNILSSGIWQQHLNVTAYGEQMEEMDTHIEIPELLAYKTYNQGVGITSWL